jgi:hypothetical protein
MPLAPSVRAAPARHDAPRRTPSRAACTSTAHDTTQSVAWAPDGWRTRGHRTPGHVHLDRTRGEARDHGAWPVPTAHALGRLGRNGVSERTARNANVLWAGLAWWAPGPVRASTNYKSSLFSPFDSSAWLCIKAVFSRSGISRLHFLFLFAAYHRQWPAIGTACVLFRNMHPLLV